MYDILIIRNGEISIKGQNRPLFENKLIKNLKYKIFKNKNLKLKKEYGRIHLYLNGEDAYETIDLIKDTFGMDSISPAIMLESNIDVIRPRILEIFNEILEKNDGKEITFKINFKRQLKDIEQSSMEMNNIIGGDVLKKFGDRVKVDVKNPDYLITVEYKKNNSIIYWEKLKMLGGLPRGINGKACILLSGGIDSPVAAFMMSKRGLSIEAVHFHSFPFTNKRSQEKIIMLLEHLKKYFGNVKLHKINLLEIQKQINEKCPSEYMTILSRRFMMRIAERIALDNECSSLITGESLGQVASQTSEGLAVTDKVVSKLPVLRPLVAFDKNDIISLAEDIGTYDISIIAEEDCCTVFLPKKVATKPTLEKAQAYEESLNIEQLINEALETEEIIEI